APGLGGTRGRCVAEGVEVDHDQVEGGDTQFFDRGHVVGVGPIRKEPAVDVRVQGLDPAAQNLGKDRNVLDGQDGHALSPKPDPGGSVTDVLRPGLVQTVTQSLQSGLVVHADQSAPDGLLGHRFSFVSVASVTLSSVRPNRTCLPSMVQPWRARRPTVSTNIRRSTCLMRSWSRASSSPSSTGTPLWAMIGPESTPSSRKW